MIVYVAVEAAAGVLASPPIAIANLVLFGAYIALITFATRRDKPVNPAAVATTLRRDLTVAVAIIVVSLAGASLFWTPVVLSTFHSLASIFELALPSPVAIKAANATLAILLLLLPAIVLLIIFRLGAGAVGLQPRHIGLGLVLAGLGIALAAGAVAAHAPVDVLWRAYPLGIATAVIALQSLVNGIPEELAFRGILTSRLLPWLGRPGNALVVSALAFSLFHVPSALASGRSPMLAVIGVFLPGLQLTGLTLGYLWYRTRSIWPGAIWHTSITGFGVMFG